MSTVEQFLHLKAPFAANRPFQSGAYRSTTPIPSPSTLYGLLLNLAAIEQRDKLEAPTTLIKENLPEIEIAIGQVSQPEMAVISQQLHQYPVGASGAELAKKTHGAKYWIAPVRRTILVNLDLVVAFKAEKWLRDRILKGINGELEESRYGLPFAGDNNFLFDEIKPIETSKMARWYCSLKTTSRPQPGICRLTIWINRADNTKTQIAEFAPSAFCLTPPKDAWIKVGKSVAF